MEAVSRHDPSCCLGRKAPIQTNKHNNFRGQVSSNFDAARNVLVVIYKQCDFILFLAFSTNESKQLRKPTLDAFGLSFDNQFGPLSRFGDHIDSLSDQTRTLLDHTRIHDNQPRPDTNRLQSRCGVPGVTKQTGDEQARSDAEQGSKDKTGGTQIDTCNDFGFVVNQEMSCDARKSVFGVSDQV